MLTHIKGFGVGAAPPGQTVKTHFKLTLQSYLTCLRRHIGLLKVKGRKMNLEKIPLKTVRQFYIQDVVLADFEDQFTPDTPQVVKKVENLCFAKVTCKSRVFFISLSLFFISNSHQSSLLSPSDCLQVTEMLEEAERERLGCPLTPEKPLIRLRVRLCG